MTTKSTLLRTIKLQCSECMGSTTARRGDLDMGAVNLVVGCTDPDCLLFQFRLGKDPTPSRKGFQKTVPVTAKGYPGGAKFLRTPLSAS